MVEESYSIEILGFEAPENAHKPVYADPSEFTEDGPYNISENTFDREDYGKFLDKIESVGVDPEKSTIHYMHEREGIFGYMIHDMEDDVALFEDSDNIFWLAFEDDEAGYVTAYFDGEKYVPANTPEIWEGWEEATTGPWMDLLEEEEVEQSFDQGNEKMHPHFRRDLAEN